MFRRNDQGSLNLEQSLIVALLVLLAAGTLMVLGQQVSCVFAREAVATAVAAEGPQGSVDMEYSGACVSLSCLEASDNGDGTAMLAWVGGEAPFTISRSDTELVAFDAPSPLSFTGVAHAATEVIEDLDGNPNDRMATVELAPGDNYFQVAEAGGDTVATTLVEGPEAVMPLCFITAGLSMDTRVMASPVTFEVEWSSGSRTWVQAMTPSRQSLIESYLFDPELGSSVRVPVLDEPVVIRATAPGYRPFEATVSFAEIDRDAYYALFEGSMSGLADWAAVDGSSVGPYPPAAPAGLYFRQDIPFEPELRLIMAPL
jgi:hypothetical protein